MEEPQISDFQRPHLRKSCKNQP